ncbi:MAG: tRNA (guanosine(46)-N7)-methyltransferase TrmB [Abditibacteriaceae bacterium]
MVCDKDNSISAPLERNQRWRETATILQKTQYVEFRNPYVAIAQQEEERGVFLEDAARARRGDWHKSTFNVTEQTSLDLEIGVGNGEFLAHHAASHPERCMLGIERKFKPLVQSLKRAKRAGLQNAALLRYQAGYLDEIFAPNELNNIYLFFPDPWPKTKHHKNRLVNDEFLKSTFILQRADSRFEIKTDNDEYFEWILRFAKNSQYEIEAQTTDLHQSRLNVANFMTQFERLWTGKGLKTKYLCLRKIEK